MYAPIIWRTLFFLYVDSSFVLSYPPTSSHQKVHQVFGLFGDDMPPHWAECSETWQSFSYKRWNKTECISAIQTIMPHRRELIDYKAVQLGDVCRVAILYLHGGVYADMDICAQKHTRFPVCDACFVKTSVGLSNDFFIVKKGHPVLLNILEMYANAKWIDNSLYLPYIRTMFTTGPVQFSLALQNYPGVQTVTYASMSLRHIHGSSWHGWDSSIFMHPYMLSLLICLLCLLNAKVFRARIHRFFNFCCSVCWPRLGFGPLACPCNKWGPSCHCCVGLSRKTGHFCAKSHRSVH